MRLTTGKRAVTVQKNTKSTTVTRAYHLAIYPNAQKLDTARYAYERHLQHVNMWVGKLFFQDQNVAISTKNLGRLAHNALHKSRGIIAAQKASAQATGSKQNVPTLDRIVRSESVSGTK
jgi:hypothetical protein